MIQWNQAEFFGIFPRLSGRLHPRYHATVAHNVDLTHGTLRPFREPLKISNSTGKVRMHHYDCCLLTYDQCVSIAEWLPDCPRLFITGRTSYPETITLDENCRPTYRRLGVQRPISPPSLGATPAQASDTTREVAYVFTFVNNFGEESAPSLPSEAILIEDEQPVNVMITETPSFEYDIQKIRIYRRESGYRLGVEKEQELITDWFLVAEIPADETTHTDTLPLERVDEALITQEVREPPAGLQNITSIDGSAMLVGSVQNRLYFSSHLKPHSFPTSDEMTLDDNIIALGSLGQSLFVATDGHPYKLVADVGCDNRDCRAIVRYDHPLPMINCHVGHGSVITPFGMVYASTDGLVLLSEGGQPQIITTEVLSTDDWRKLQPHTTRLAYHKGALFIITDAISMMMWINSSTYQDSRNKKLITISDKPIDMTQTRQGELLLMLEDGIYQWNASNKWRPYKWVSERIDAGFHYDITRIRARVHNDDVTITTESERTRVSRVFPIGERSIPFRRHGKVKEFTIAIEGIGELEEITAGVALQDMTGAKR